MQKLKIKKLSGSLGASISDISLRKLSTADFKQVANALWEYQVLIFNRQSLPIDDHITLGQKFGALHTHPAAKGVEGHPEVLWLNNRGKEKNITEAWHSDVSCEEKPPSISILQAIQSPAFGGDTIWANQ